MIMSILQQFTKNIVMESWYVLQMKHILFEMTQEESV